VTGSDKKNRAVFLDRDGTINEEVGYLSRLEELKIYDNAAEAIRLLRQKGFLAIVITNQSGVARGFFSEDFILTVHNKMNEYMKERGAWLDALYYCPHHPRYGNEHYRKECSCRKPHPGLLIRAAEDFDIDLKRSYVVGDMPRDMDTARRVGAKGVMVKTGYGRNVVATSKPDYIAEDLLDAANWIIRDQEIGNTDN
jgi:D,D-heptose 1,7-bisphosphate phosphatase